MATAAGVGGAAFLGGNALFSYNRANYMFDAGQKWARYMAGYTYAQDQVGMYRQDVDQITGITVGKMDNIHAVSGLMVVIIIQLIMAGRLGVHGPAPPGWIMGLYWPNTGMTMMWLALSCWLAMHAGARAQAAASYMKTHSVRLPIPTPKQLDKARVYGNHWERQRVFDVFRVPFVTPAPVDDKADLRDEVDGKGKAKSNKKTRKTAGHTSDFRTPAWINEEIRDLYSGSGGVPVTNDTTPVHFEELRGAQHEWWAHESYARVCIFFAWTHWLAGASLYIMCHCFIELRAMWPAWSCTFPFVACHFCMNMLEINGRAAGRSTCFNVPMEYVVPFTPLIAVSLMQIDYSVLEEWRSTWSVFIWICSFISYIVHFLYALRMYDLAMPSPGIERPDKEAGKPWWQPDWQLPLAFQHCLYLVSPPKHLEPGETDLWQEMKAGRGHESQSRPPVKSRTVSPQTQAWFIVRGALLSTIFVWGFIIIGRVYAMALIRSNQGDMRYQLKQEGRAMRWPSHMQPWMTPWTRLGTRNEYCHTGGCDRRLGEYQWKSRHAMAGVAERIVPNLQTISDVLAHETQPHTPAQVVAPVYRVALEWPADLKPEMLACSHAGPVLAISRYDHMGAVLSSLPFAGAATIAHPEIQRFAFEGTRRFGEVIGSHWGDDGLLLAMKNGHLAECEGKPVNSIWSCKQLNTRLPLGGSSLRKAVVARIPKTKTMLRAAVVFHNDNSSVALFEVDIESGVWVPSGEARLPPFTQQVPTFSLSSGADELVLPTEGGGVLKWAIAATEPVTLAAPPQHNIASGTVWHTACHLGDNRIARLGWRPNENWVWAPELFTSTSA